MVHKNKIFYTTLNFMNCEPIEYITAMQLDCFNAALIIDEVTEF